MSLLDVCVCVEVFAEVCIRLCTNVVDYPRGRQMAERNEPVSLRGKRPLHSHARLGGDAPSSAVSPQSLSFTGLSHCYTWALTAANSEAT